MRTRGISEAEARMLLQFAFMSDVIENVRLDALKDRLRQLVEKRFRGELSQCQQCAMRTQIRKHETRNKYERKRTWKKKDGQNG
jgi:hypothetical protein